MKKISIWAVHHKWLSRFIIITSHLLLMIIAFFVADILPTLNVNFKGKYLYVVVIIIAAFLYPDKRQRQRYKNFYRRQKIHDFILVSFGFLIMISLCTTSKREQPLKDFSTIAFGSVAVVAGIENISLKKSKKAKHISKNIVRKAFKNQFAKIRKAYRETSTAGKGALIALSLFVAILLAYSVTVMSCSLSCSGSEGLAAVVVIVGLGGIVFGLIKVIQAITGKRKMRKTERVMGTKT